MIFLDPRRGSGDLISFLPAGTTLLHLDSGDAMSSGYGPGGPLLWGVEVKRLSDALQCMQDGRLAATQLVRMHDDYEMVYLLIEEDMGVDRDSGLLQKRVRKQKPDGKWREFWVDVVYGASQRVVAVHFLEWLLSLNAVGGLRLLSSVSRQMTAAWIVALHNFWSKPWTSHKSLNVFDDSHPPRFVLPTVAAMVARALGRGEKGESGIGWEKAFAAAEYFGSPQEMVNAGEDRWREVDGIDKVIAGRAVANATRQHVRTVKRGFSGGGGVRNGKSIGAHGNVQEPANRASTAKRRNPVVPVRGADKVEGPHRRGRRAEKKDRAEERREHDARKTKHVKGKR